MAAGAQAFLGRLGQIGLGVALAGGVVNQALYNVDGGQRAVIFDRFAGVKETVSGEGTHFLIPWVQRPIIFNIRSTPRNVPCVTGSKDLQPVHITLRILHRPMPDQLPKIYTNLGQDYEERVLPSITNEVLKAIVAQYNAEEMITQRETVSSQVCNALRERCNQFGILLDDISLTHLSFSRDFTDAVEQKQVAQQEAERARYLVERAEFVKTAMVISAEGDAKAAELISKACTEAGNGLIELRKIEAAEENAVSLAKARNVIYLPGDQSNLIQIPHT